MSASRNRKEAAKRLGTTLTVQHRNLLEADGESDISEAAVILGRTFNDNIEFICWVLKEYGGVSQMPFASRRARVRPTRH